MSKIEKRADLQGIRGIAIISVVGFHFFPDYVPNGYLGVDQFFVLSGFLMSMLLQNSSDQPVLSQVIQFYSKRFKRIVPLYFLLIGGSMISLYWKFPEVSWKTNKEAGKRAMIFMSNRRRTAEEDYFQMLSLAMDIFTHTWSLSVEVQFYLILPLIYLLGRLFSKNLQYGYYFLIGSLSFMYSITSTPTVSFNSVFSRIWQFLIGFFIHIYSEPKKEIYQKIPEEEMDLLDVKNELENVGTQETSGKTGVFLVFLYSFDGFLADEGYNIETPYHYSHWDPYPPKTSTWILEIRLLCYLGDISYVLYLVHWPIYCFWKLTCQGDPIALVTCLAASILVSIAIHETFEKWYSKQGLGTVTLVTLALVMVNLVLLNKDEIMDKLKGAKDYGSPDKMTLEKAARLNHLWNLNDYGSLFVPACDYESRNSPFGWCRHKNLSGSLRIMIIGNSWAANHGTMFHQECGRLAGSILQGAASACEPLYPSRLSEVCKSNFTDFEERVRIEKPDYLFIFTRFVTIGDDSGPTGDLIYEIMRRQMKKLIKNVGRKMYILDAMPRPNIEVIERIVPMIGRGIGRGDIDNLLVNHTLYRTARRRYAQLVNDCGKKCVLVDYNLVFWNSTTRNFRFYDEQGLSYFTTTTHLTPRGIEHVRHVWRDICDSLEK